MYSLEPLPENRLGTTPERHLRLDAAELTDPDGDALTITTNITNTTGIWFTCTSDGDEVTVGPFPAESLKDALRGVGTGARVPEWSVDGRRRD